MIKLLVVDDSALVRKLLGQVFAVETDFDVEFARNGLEALDKLKAFRPNVVTLDINMPEMDGLACLDRIMVERPCPVVMVSSLTSEGAEATLAALRLGAVDFLAKPQGTASLYMAEWAPALAAKVRQAAVAKIGSLVRLSDRIRHRKAAAALSHGAARTVSARITRVSGPSDGLVLVGASTGGPPALEALLANLPATFPWPILVAQHMPASFTGALARRLDGVCALSVIEVARPVALRPGIVYIGRGDADLVVSRRQENLIAMAAPSRADYPWHPSVDRLVRTAMDHLPANLLIGVLMTGMGVDGAEAMTGLHAAGGRTIAEAEETAVVWGMPGELVKAGGADWIAPLGDIAQQLKVLVNPHASHPS